MTQVTEVRNLRKAYDGVGYGLQAMRERAEQFVIGLVLMAQTEPLFGPCCFATNFQSDSRYMRLFAIKD